MANQFKGSKKFHGPSKNGKVESTGDGNDLTAEEFTDIILGDTNDSVQTITIPSSAVKEGNYVIVVDSGGNAGTNAITVSAEGGENINGSDQDLSISTNYGKMELVSDGSGWFATTTAP